MLEAGVALANMRHRANSDGGTACPGTRDLVLVLGGCHVGGYLVGKKNGFAAVLSAVGAPCEDYDVIAVPQFSKRAIGDVLRAYAGRRIAAVILQLGHKETMIASRDPRPDWAKGKVSGESGDSGDPGPERASISAKVYAKAVGINLALGVVGRSWLGFEPLSKSDQRFQTRFADEVEDLFTALYHAHIPQVLVLPCFPSAKSWLNAKRQVANVVLRSSSKRHGYRYVEVWDRLSFQNRPMRNFARPSLLADEAHLSTAGHRQVADAVAGVWR